MATKKIETKVTITSKAEEVARKGGLFIGRQVSAAPGRAKAVGGFVGALVKGAAEGFRDGISK